MSYQVVFLHDPSGDYVQVATAETLSQAVQQRHWSGDLIYQDGGIVQSQDWLWEWEKQEESCYAQKMIRQNPPLNKRIPA